ncbi:Wzz/FepE/Etk N-terminal domain-containing protein [Marinobacter sp.]|uniref:Wzz/FepE/Etk N-terminal domain-containing protein n=1 Tax=Marinobacter sp. TaxID=50741 RepID=UPI0034A4C613
MNQPLTPLQPGPQPYRYDHLDDEIDLRELFAVVWHGKWWIIAISLLFALGSIAYALAKPDIYTANATLAPATGEDGGNLGKLAGQFGGLASMAGINLGGGSASKTVIAKEVLQSRIFLTKFIQRHGLAVALMATESWDKRNNSWVIDQDIYNPATGEWQADEATGESRKPTDWDLVKAFRANLRVNQSADTGMLTISFSSQSPSAARDWVALLVRDINEHMRAQDVASAERSIGYLEEKLEETNVSGMQQVFYQLIEQETRTVMLANAQKEYVFKTVDPAVAPQEKSEPKRALIVIVGTLLGGMLAVFIVFVRAFIKKTGNPNNE